ncbi:MAG TPA: serine/threonine-protein kinase [Candidatus Nanoarchaeia archaeon]|nr:serine/threonine-protein kinase [Candidatus Nanoarchaeia archaeon]
MNSPISYHLAPGNVVQGRYDAYKLRGLLDETGMSKVFVAESKRHESLIVVKEYLHNRRSHAFEREGYAHDKIHELGGHPNIVSAIEFIPLDDGTNLGVFPYVSGETLKNKLLKLYPFVFHPSRIAKYFAEICGAIDYINGLGIIHRDIKSGNVIITEKPSGLVAKVIDFGVSVHPEIEDLDLEGGVAYGTPQFIAPEAIIGDKKDYRSDIYSLGILGFQLLCNAVPFDDSNLTKIALQHLEDPLPQISAFNPYVKPAMQEVLEIATAKKPEDRYQTANELKKYFLRAI